MKTTLDLNDTLIANAKALAAQQRTTLTRVVEEGLRMRLASSRASKRAPSFRLPAMRGKGGLVAGIDPRSNSSMLDAADSDDT
ncbi:MAG: DUF6364 family protein [Caldimonas sp.]|nr:DUF6364 family protein [Pseudomonadota bacterium]